MQEIDIQAIARSRPKVLGAVYPIWSVLFLCTRTIFPEKWNKITSLDFEKYEL